MSILVGNAGKKIMQSPTLRRYYKLNEKKAQSERDDRKESGAESEKEEALA